MNCNLRRVMSFVFASAAFCAAIAAPAQRAGQRFRPDSAPERIKPILPQFLQLTPKNPVHPAASLVGLDVAYFDPFLMEMHLSGKYSAAGVRIRDQQVDTSYTVDFAIRIRAGTMTFYTNTNAADRRAQETKLALAQSLQHIVLRGRTLRGKGALVLLESDSDAAWELIAVKITKP